MAERQRPARGRAVLPERPVRAVSRPSEVKPQRHTIRRSLRRPRLCPIDSARTRTATRLAQAAPHRQACRSSTPCLASTAQLGLAVYTHGMPLVMSYTRTLSLADGNANSEVTRVESPALNSPSTRAGQQHKPCTVCAPPARASHESFKRAHTMM